MTTPSYTADTLHAKVLARLIKEYPRASAKRLGDLASRVVTHGGCGLSSFNLEDALLEMHIAFLSGQHPSLLEHVPDDGAVFDALLAKEEARVKTENPDAVVDSRWKLEIGHKLPAFSEEARFAALVGFKAKAAPPVAAPAPSTPSCVESLNAELVRMGYDVSKMLPLERQRLYRAVEANRAKEAAAKPTASSADMTLPPAERIKIFRQEAAQEAAANAAPKALKPGQRDRATGLTSKQNRA